MTDIPTAYWTTEDKNTMKDLDIPLLPTRDAYLVFFPGESEVKASREASAQEFQGALLCLNQQTAGAFCKQIANDSRVWPEPIREVAKIGNNAAGLVEKHGYYDVGILAVAAANKIIDIFMNPFLLGAKKEKN